LLNNFSVILQHAGYDTNLYSSPNIVLVIKIKNEMGGACSAYGDERGVYRVLVGKPEGKRLLGRPRLRLEDNINTDLQKVGCRGMNWIKVTEDGDRWRAIGNAVMNLRVP
jgi:hypothetical protein